MRFLARQAILDEINRLADAQRRDYKSLSQWPGDSRIVTRVKAREWRLKKLWQDYRSTRVIR